ncbi:MAG: sigma-54 dependent transcriptional regulator [Bacteroidetes bacterium]|jgi:DNA-binding NtrC family response regulator|nr:sigma-54 dependent transcriptional regulator [Bacteroidota bacterium]
MAATMHILLVDDEESVTYLLQTEFQEYPEFSIATASNGGDAMNLVRSKVFDIALLDIRMPRVSGLEVLRFIKEHSPTTQVIMLTALADVKNAVEATRLGAYDFLSKPYDFDVLMATVRRAVEHRQLLIDKEVNAGSRPIEIIGSSKTFQDAVGYTRKLAASDAVVLIQGESGTGKELFAQLIHRESPRRTQAFVAVNCAAMPDQLLESELFGHEKGAFTSAIKTKQGLVEVANGGTLFLDEVGDISPLVQPKLLRFLETGEFRRVGGNDARTVDVRVVSATNKNLSDEVKAGRFRDDLLYRLNVVGLRLPPLREHKEDIPHLVAHFLHRKSRSKTLSPAAMEVLMRYDWPGNVRELEHVIEGAVALAHGEIIEPSDLWMNVGLRADAVPVSREVMSASPMASLEDVEAEHIERVLRANDWNRTRSAHILGITPKTLYLKIKRYGIRVPPEA